MIHIKDGYWIFYVDNSSEVLGCCDYISGSQARFRNLVHFHKYQENAIGQLWTLEHVAEIALPATVPPSTGLSLQPQPTTRGTYRIKLHKTDSDAYMEYGPSGFVRLGSIVPENDPKARMFEWVIAPVSGQTDTFTIEPVFKDEDDNSTIGIIRKSYFKVGAGYCAYEYLFVGEAGSSANWKIVKDARGTYSRIYLDNSPDVVGCCDSRHVHRFLVHFHKYQESATGQEGWVFKPLNIAPPATGPPSTGSSSTVPPTLGSSTDQSPLPKRARSSYETHFFTLTPQKAAEKPYDIIVVGTGIGGGVIAGDLFESNSRLGKNAKSVLVIEIGDLPFHSHCLNSSRPTGFDEDRGQQNDTFYSLFREKYKFPHDTDDWNGGPMYNLGGRSAAWGLFSPRIHDEILAHQFAPRTELHDELVRTWYRAAEDLMGLSLPTTTPAHQNLMERLNIKNNFRNTGTAATSSGNGVASLPNSVTRTILISHVVHTAQSTNFPRSR